MNESEIRAAHLKAALTQMRNVRAWSIKNDINPWAFRQALLFALEVDTHHALQKVKKEDLDRFDKAVKEDTQGWIAEQ